MQISLKDFSVCFDVLDVFKDRVKFDVCRFVLRLISLCLYPFVCLSMHVVNVCVDMMSNKMVMIDLSLWS